MTASVRPSSYSYVVDEPLLRTIASEIQAAIPGAEVRLFGSRARGSGQHLLLIPCGRIPADHRR